MKETSEDVRLAVPVSKQDHMRGPENAPVTIVEYGDFQCPYCGEAYPIFKEAQKQAGDKLRFVFRNFPIVESHPYAEQAAEAAEAAGAQGKYWQMHDMLFEHQDALDRESLITYARQLGLDIARFERDLDGEDFSTRIADDYLGGERSGVEGTPTFFLNGELYMGDWENVNNILAAIHEAARS